MIRRRDLITLLGGAAAWPVAARAQQTGTRVVGVLTSSSRGDGENKVRLKAFLETLDKLGWTDGRNIRLEYRWGVVGTRQTRAAATELIAAAPSVILAQGTPISEALLEVTRTIPIVFVGASDPVNNGLVGSMARPGGNLTGFTNFEFSMGGKWLEMLKEASPRSSRMLVMYSLGNTGSKGFLATVQTAGLQHNVKIVEAAVRGAPDIERSLAEFGPELGDGLVVLPAANLAIENRELIVALTARYRLAAIYPYRLLASAGGLMSYDTDVADLYRRAASYTDRILRGEHPGNLPVQTPTKYHLVVNLKTAKALGLAIPPTLLARADEVIE
jgi:putative ABC transport system substrate-binding protein